MAAIVTHEPPVWKCCHLPKFIVLDAVRTPDYRHGHCGIHRVTRFWRGVGGRILIANCYRNVNVAGAARQRDCVLVLGLPVRYRFCLRSVSIELGMRDLLFTIYPSLTAGFFQDKVTVSPFLVHSVRATTLAAP